MDVEKLKQLLFQTERATLDFKREWYKIDDSNGETKKRQRSELIKDILALANGNAVVAGETAYLIIGADDQLDEENGRRLYSVSDPMPTAGQILQLVNAACDPPIEDLWCEAIDIDGHQLLVVTIPSSPYLYETTRKLETPSSTYTKHVVFVRHNEQIAVASAKERDAILELKKKRHAEARNAPPVLFGAGVGALLIGPIFAQQLEKRTGKPEGRRIGWGVGMTVGGFVGGMIGETYKNLVEIKIDWPHMSNAQRAFAVITLLGTSLVSYWMGSSGKRNK
jgi:hypothetical protein